MVSTSVPVLRIGPIQAGGDSPGRRPIGDICVPRGSTHVLLAPLSLAFNARRRVSTPHHNSYSTSNDLLRRLVAKHTTIVEKYLISGQGAENVQNAENAPVISMGPYLLETGQLTGTGSDGVRYCFKLVRPGILSE